MLLLSLFSLGSLATGQRIQINPETRMFTDEYGRTVIFHGVNAIYKLPPYFPNNETFSPQDSLTPEDILNLTSWGFNFIRLGVMWEAVEYSLGKYNDTYLSIITNMINALGEQGIYTLVDAHQDVFARKICGEGVPDYYAANLTDKCEGPFGGIFQMLGACNPFSELHYQDDQNGNPLLSDCAKKMFAWYYSTPEAADAFSRLYTNKDSYQDWFLKYWDHVTKTIGGNPYIVGYDIINEPLAANMITEPWTAIPGVNDYVNLSPMYQKAQAIMSENDPEAVVFFEPIQGDVMPFLGGMVFPVGFTEPIANSSYMNRMILNDHSYCCQAGASICANGEPDLNYTDICTAFNYARVTSRAIDAKNLNLGLIISEFGACFDSQNCVNEITSVTNACDDNLVGWAYWQFKNYSDFTTSAGFARSEGFYNVNGTLQSNKVKSLARTYVPYYQGVPYYINFNPSTGAFVTSFTLDPSVTNTTVLFAHQGFYYGSGMNVVVNNTYGTGCTNITELATNDDLDCVNLGAGYSCSYKIIKPNYYSFSFIGVAQKVNTTITITSK